MVKIFYGVSGEGMGHATRSQPIIQHLEKKHAVHVFAGSRAGKYFEERTQKFHRISSMHIHYVSNSVSDAGTFFWNLARAPLYLFSFMKVFVLMLYHNPDIILTDFEPFTSWWAALLNKPLISIANIQFVSKTSHMPPEGHRFDAFKTHTVSNLITPSADFFIIPAIAEIPAERNTALCNPPLRKDVLSAKTSDRGHLLVYQTSKTNRKLVRILLDAGIDCTVYGFGTEKRIKKLQFRKFSEEQFYKDLASARAVITNGGFSLIAEALYMKKPLFMIPVRKQYEQLANALEVKRLGFGKLAYSPDKKNLRQFMSQIPEYRNRLRNYRRYDNKKLFALIDKKISELTS